MVSLVRSLVVALAALAGAGCALTPGLDFSLSSKGVGLPAELGGYDYINLSHEFPISNGHSVDSYLLNTDKVRFGTRNLFAESRSISGEYLIGPGDVLTIIVWEHPELTSPTGEFRDSASSGRLVDSRGNIFYPYIGEIAVSGFSVSQVRELIRSRLSRVVRNPQVDVRVSAFRAKRATVLGGVANPGSLALSDQSTSLVQALAVVGGRTEDAVKDVVLLRRGGREFAFRVSNENSSSTHLIDGDVVYIPRADERGIYVLGEVNKEGYVPLLQERVSLNRVIADVGGLRSGSADSRAIYVIRSSESDDVKNSRPKVYALDYSDPMAALIAEKFYLAPSDVLIVDRTGLSKFNSIIAQVLPSVSTIFQVDRLISD